MKTVSLYNIPISVAKDAMTSMKALITAQIKNEDMSDLYDLIFTLQNMIESISDAESAVEV